MNYKLSNIFKFLSVKSKMDIIIHLFTCQCLNCCVNSLCHFCKNKQSNISKHLIDLKKENIVVYQRLGKNIKYQLSESFIQEYKEILDWILKKENYNIQCSC